MLDPKLLRENPQAIDAMLVKRGGEPLADKLKEMDEKRRLLMGELQELQSKRNDISKQIGISKSKGEDASSLFEEMKSIGPKAKELEEAEREAQAKFEDAWSRIPNMMDDSVPEGEDEDDNVELRTWGEPTKLNFDAKEHFELGEDLGMMDFELASKVCGSRFWWNRGDIARLERALASFMLDLHVDEHGFEETVTPALTTPKSMYGTGQLPKFEDDAFVTNDERGLMLIPTSEVTMTNFMQERIVQESELPFRFTAHTPCFRKEAGSAGRDTRGLIRVHQFHKVEMVQIVHPEKSMEALDFMLGCAETVLQKLELPYRVVTLCAGDIGFGAIKTFDIEVWLPGQNAYREISSCSNCGDFQARRMNGRYKSMDTGKNHYVHTLNGSGVAVGRCLVAVLENYQQEDGSIVVPEVLRPYMRGQEIIKKKS